ncbi:MAG TPA: type II toxin-antitoxin system CcdA family antitoxin [Rubrivivax sp.]|nr:type II toxin-antitoxin system CcdA family antitoxin [Rubrivivax sp.]
MKPPSPATSSRKATNVTIDARLLEHAKSLGINISKASEEGLSRAVAAKQEAIWLVSNQAALESSNAYVDRNGIPLAKHRNF